MSQNQGNPSRHDHDRQRTPSDQGTRDNRHGQHGQPSAAQPKDDDAQTGTPGRRSAAESDGHGRKAGKH